MNKSNTRYLNWLLLNSKSNLQKEFDKAFLGIIWWVIDPVFYLLLFYVVFGLIFKRGDGEGFVYFLLCGLVFWRWFETCVRQGMMSITVNPALLTQIYLPKWLLPLSAITGATMRFCLVLVVFLLFLLLAGFRPSASWFSIPILILLQLLLNMAAGMFLGAIIPLIPDLQHVMNYVITALFFSSGIFFSIEQITGDLYEFLKFNPILIILNSWRSVLLDGTSPDWQVLSIVAVSSIILIILALTILRKYDRYYARVVL